MKNRQLLYGGEGSDTLYGDDGDDIFYGDDTHKLNSLHQAAFAWYGIDMRICALHDERNSFRIRKSNFSTTSQRS
ncbi:MAG: hypothetical protein LBU53_03995 [Zoogloeaceae bacterium]|nr:hypothetical protein [Zoogloeaceae bacterium]